MLYWSDRRAGRKWGGDWAIVIENRMQELGCWEGYSIYGIFFKWDIPGLESSKPLPKRHGQFSKNNLAQRSHPVYQLSSSFEASMKKEIEGVVEGIPRIKRNPTA